MPRVYRQEGDKIKEGYLVEVDCPVCGNPIPTVFWFDETRSYAKCPICGFNGER